MAHLQNIHKGSSIAAGICVKSESTLACALNEIKSYCHEIASAMNVEFYWKKSIGIHELIPGSKSDKKCFINPDGGLFFVKIDSKSYCFMIVEDKYQGTNDVRKSKNLPKQSTGNAIERVFKNLNASWHLFKDLPICPYLVFVAGCDFHNTETIIDRIGPISNFGRDPIVWEMEDDTAFDPNDMLSKINLKKDNMREFATFCVKTHKYDQFPHGSSLWQRDERLKIMKHVAYESLKGIVIFHNRYERICTPAYDNIHR
jgi:hypothetical protein